MWLSRLDGSTGGGEPWTRCVKWEAAHSARDALPGIQNRTSNIQLPTLNVRALTRRGYKQRGAALSPAVTARCDLPRRCASTAGAATARRSDAPDLDLKVVNKYLCQKLSSGVRQDVSPVSQFQAKQTEARVEKRSRARVARMRSRNQSREGGSSGDCLPPAVEYHKGIPSSGNAERTRKMVGRNEWYGSAQGL
jgi:hypothetical protein